jgi:hypothetical protein
MQRETRSKTKALEKAPANVPNNRRTRSQSQREAGSVVVQLPQDVPPPTSDSDDTEITNPIGVTSPVMSLVHPKMRQAWKINKGLPMWLKFDVVNPVRQFKRDMHYTDDAAFPAYGPAPWPDLTETDEPSSRPGLMPYAPINYKCACSLQLSKDAL